MQAFNDCELDFLRDVLIAIVIVYALVALALLAAINEEHNVLKVLLVDKISHDLPDACESVHHDEESEHGLDEAFADVEFAGQDLDSELIVA